jgi:hypothetical protein
MVRNYGVYNINHTEYTRIAKWRSPNANWKWSSQTPRRLSNQQSGTIMDIQAPTKTTASLLTRETLSACRMTNRHTGGMTNMQTHRLSLARIAACCDAYCIVTSVLQYVLYRDQGVSLHLSYYLKSVGCKTNFQLNFIFNIFVSMLCTVHLLNVLYR